jgi:uncharacterized protein (TIGR03435 family)
MRILIVFAAAVVGVAAPADPPRFEVASVKATANIQSGYGNERVIAHPGSVTMHNMRLRALIQWACDVKDYQISAPAWMGEPGWLGSDLARFEISAKAAPNTEVAELRRMLQTMLAERFKLKLHRESKEITGFQMTVAERGFARHASDDPDGESAALAPRGKPAIILKSTTLAQFAELIAGPLRVPVVDSTGIQGRYDINIDLAPFAGPGNEDAYTIIRAIEEQLGLKFEKRKIQLETLVIDHAEKMPTEN